DPDGRAHRLGLGRDIVPGDAYRPAVGLQQRGQHVDRRCLARPIRAEQGKDRARTNIQIDAVEDGLATEGLAQAGGRDRAVRAAPFAITAAWTATITGCGFSERRW